MNEDFSSKVKALLEDPEMLAKIAAIAGSLGGQTAPASPSAPQSAPPAAPTAGQSPSIQTVAEQNSPIPQVSEQVKQPQIPSIPSIPAAATKPDPRVALLNSIKPFLRAERQAKVDTLTRALTVANLFGTMKKKQ
jgi:hypothetical protein